jgi:metallo-beta-lactamase class B
MTNHSEFDYATTKIKLLAARKPGEPHPYELGKEAVARYFTVTGECAEAQRLKVMQMRAAQ